MEENVKNSYKETMKDPCALVDSELDTVSGGNLGANVRTTGSIDQILDKYRDDDGPIKSRVERTIEDLNNQLKDVKVDPIVPKILGE